MSIMYIVGLGVFLYGIFFGGEGSSRKKIFMPSLGHIDTSDPKLFSVTDSRSFRELNCVSRFPVGGKPNGEVEEMFFDIVDGFPLSDILGDEDAGGESSSFNDKHGNADSNSGGGEGC